MRYPQRMGRIAGWYLRSHRKLPAGRYRFAHYRNSNPAKPIADALVVRHIGRSAPNLLRLRARSQIVLLRILRTQMSWKLSEQQDRTEHRPVHSLTAWGAQDSIERIRSNSRSILVQKRCVELRVEHKRAAAKRRLRAELLQHQLFDRVIENSKSGAYAALPRAAKTFAQNPSVAPGLQAMPYAWSERFVISVG